MDDEDRVTISIGNGRAEVKDAGIDKELGELDLPESVKRAASSIYYRLQLNTTRRKKKRQMLIFYCIYYGYRGERITIDPHDLAVRVGLEKNEISKAITMYSSYDPNPILQSRPTPIGYIKKYFSFTELSPNLEENIIDIYTTALENDPDISDESSPQNIAAVIIILFMRMNGIEEKISIFLDKINKKEQSLKNILRAVSDAYNG